MEQYITEIGVGGLFAYLILKLMLDFLKTKPLSKDCDKLTDAIEALEQAIREQTKAIQALSLESKLNQQSLKRMSADIFEIRQAK